MTASRALLRRPSLACRSCMRRFQPQSQRSYSAKPDDLYDLVCVGGGPAGLSLLTALRANPTTAGLRIALVEAQDLSKAAAFSLPANKFSNRCSSLTPASAIFLHNLGAWAYIQRDRVQEYHAIKAWDGISNARIDFGLQPSGPASGGKEIAYMIENLNLTSGLFKRLKELGGVEVFDKCKVESIHFGEQTQEADLREWPVVQLSGGQSLTTRLLVGADGANSPVRSFAGIESRGWDYDRRGVVATLQLQEDGWGDRFSKIAYQRFLPTGPVAMLPMPGNFATLVWSTTPENATVLESLSPTDFIAMVNSAFRLSPADLAYMHTQPSGQTDELTWRLQHTPIDRKMVPPAVVGVQEGTVASFPLKLRHADTYIGERIALVGDAAHTIHPLAGQGLNQGQADVRSLVSAIEYAVSHGQDIGAQMWLEQYNSERYAVNHVLLGLCDKLHKLYSVQSGPLVGLRSFGLRAVNAMGPLKGFLMEQASGMGAKIL